MNETKKSMQVHHGGRRNPSMEKTGITIYINLRLMDKKKLKINKTIKNHRMIVFVTWISNIP